MDRSVEIRVGIVIFAAIVGLVIGLVWLTEAQVRDRGYTIEAIFPTAAGIAPGDPVLVGGVKQGRVKAVSLRAQDVIISLLINSGTQIRRDAKITVADQGLMGTKIVSISLGSSPDVVQPGEIVQGATSSGITEAMEQLSGVLSDLGRIVDDFEVVLGDSTNREMVRRAITNSTELAAELNALVKNTRPGVESAVVDFGAAARGLRGVVEANSDKIGRTVDRTEAAVAQLDSTMTDLRTMSASLHAITARIEAGEGTIGKLANDEMLYTDLRKTVKDLDQLLLDIQANPKKYINFSVF
ncbi:MAG: MlaD family protein [bacterium]